MMNLGQADAAPLTERITEIHDVGVHPLKKRLLLPRVLFGDSFIVRETEGLTIIPPPDSIEMKRSVELTYGLRVGLQA